jgi:hypothetical protein
VNQQTKTLLMTGGLAVLTAVAIVFAVSRMRHIREGDEAGGRVWFYDQSAKRLYPAPHNLIPPDGGEEVRVRAIVIGFQGVAMDVSQLKIAYLEKYSPDFKALLERAEAAHTAKIMFEEKVPPQSSAYFQTNFFVKGPEETDWHTSGSPEGRQLMTEWRSWRGPGGQPPVVSMP